MPYPAGIEPRDEPAADGTATALLAGIVERVLFERPETGYRVLRVRAAGERDLVVVVGTLPPAEPGELIRAEGGWYDDRSWGRQFRATTASLDAPASEAGLVAYLGSGRIKGVGEELARRLVGHFGVRLGEVIEREPMRLREIEGVGPKLAARLQEAWQGHRQARDTLVFLAEQGLSPARANRVLEAYGASTVATISRDPYTLARDIRGIGFATADEIALRLGVAPGFDPAPRCCDGGGAAARGGRGQHRPAAEPTRDLAWAICSMPQAAVGRRGHRARAAGRAPGRADR